mgnify:CR=1 FL=1
MSEHDVAEAQTEATGFRTRLSATTDKLNKAARGIVNRITENGERLLNELVETGEALRGKAGDKAKAVVPQDWRANLAHVLGLPTRDEMDALGKKLDRISRKVNKMAREQKAAG